MDNGSLNTNGTGAQREARMCRDGGGGRVATITGWAVSPRWKKNPVFCSQIVAVFC